MLLLFCELNIPFGSIVPPAITQETSAFIGGRGADLSVLADTTGTDASQKRACTATYRQFRCTAAGPAQLKQLNWGFPGWSLSPLAAGDDVIMMPQSSDKLCAFMLSVVEVGLLTEEPRATAVKNNNKTNKIKAQCSRNLRWPFSEMHSVSF